MEKLNIDFKEFSKKILAMARPIEGYLADEEMIFLAGAAICATTEGTVLEIGSYKGKSTVVLAESLRTLAPEGKIVAVDPLTSPSSTDPDLKGAESCRDQFHANLKNAGVENNVEFHQKLSSELASDWKRRIRFLWIDGDHTYKGTKTDLELFYPYLANGAIVAFHDLLHRFEGPDRVFAEQILLSPNFGAFGICRSIGWAQYFMNASLTRQFRKRKLKLYRKLTRIIPYSALNPPARQSGLAKIRYKLWRAMIPHSGISPSNWLSELTFFN